MNDDAEIAAFPAVAAALGPLDPAAQARVIKWAAGKYGVSLVAKGDPKGGPEAKGRAGRGSGSANGGRGRGGSSALTEVESEDVDENAVYAAVAEETGVSVERLEQVFHVEGGSVKLLGASTKFGSSTADKARNIALLVTVVRRLGMGRADTPYEVIKEACESKHAYDSRKFASNHLIAVTGCVVKGEGGTRRLEAKGAGFTAFPLLIDQILGDA